MVDPGPASNKPKVEVWKALAWIGGAGLVFVLFVAQMMFLAFGSRIFAERQMERLKRSRYATEHPALPPWLPVYPGAVAKGSAGKLTGEVALQTKDSPERVLDFYADRLRPDGFMVEPRTEEREVFRLHARRWDGKELTVQSGTGNVGTWIVLTYKNTG